MKFLTILGAWCVVFPIKMVSFLILGLLELAEMPARTWRNLEEILEDIHSNEIK